MDLILTLLGLIVVNTAKTKREGFYQIIGVVIAAVLMRVFVD